MKIFRSLTLALSLVITFFSCQKELKFDDNGVSSGSFKKDAAGDCIPVTVNGIFKVDSVLTNDLYVDVQVNVVIPGNFEIRSDTLNGFSFRKVGSVVFGTNTIRLYPSGKPLVGGTNTFTITYGASTCKFDITVAGPGAPAATYTLGGTPGTCTGVTIGGTYTVGVTLTPANTLTVQVNVVNAGTYFISAATTSGFIFNGSGIFTNTGLQNVTLNGSGTPSVAGNASVIVSTPSLNTCTYSISVLASGGGGGTASNYYFQFNDGTSLIAADTAAVVALAVPNSGNILLSVQGISITGDSAFTVSVATNGNPLTGVTYKTNNISVPIAVFNGISTLNGQLYEADIVTLSQNINIKFDVIDTINKIVSGTFSGTAQKGTSGIATITNGKFRAQLQ